MFLEWGGVILSSGPRRTELKRIAIPWSAAAAHAHNAAGGMHMCVVACWSYKITGPLVRWRATNQNLAPPPLPLAWCVPLRTPNGEKNRGAVDSHIWAALCRVIISTTVIIRIPGINPVHHKHTCRSGRPHPCPPAHCPPRHPHLAECQWM